MSGSTLSDRLKNVEDEINEITSLMSLNDSPSAESVCRTSSEASTDRTSASAHTASSRCHQNLSGSQLRRIHSRNTSRSDVRLGDSFQSFRSSSNSTAQSDGTNTINSNLTNNGSGKDKDISLPLKISPSNLPSLAGDDITTPHFDTLGTYLNCYSTTSKGNQSILAKLNGIQTEGAKPASAPSSTYSLDPPTKNYKELLKELENEKSKRITADRSLEECKSELRKYKQEAMRSKELYTKYCELNEQLEKENLKQSELLLSMEKRNGGSDVDIELTKQKCETILKDLQSEQERSWCQERELQRMKECMEQSQLKIQELMGARTMAVELAHDLQKKHHKYVSEHQQELQQLKNKNSELEKLQDEIICERNTFLQQLHNMEDISRNADQLESQVELYKKSLSEAESTILEFSRNPENVPQVKNMLDAQEQTFKAALTEKATTEMALLAKYTTLEVELQIIQEDYNKKVSELEQEHKKTVEELNKKLEEQTYEISKLKLLTEELTEISNQYKARISELSDVNKHQEVLIKCQNEAISSKEERVRLTNQEADLNVRRADQEKKSLVMEHEKNINNLKKLLDEERDKVRVKEKIADDQAETIIRLKQNLTEKSKELQRKQKEFSQIENNLKQEKQERENLYCDVQHLKMHRSRLKESINDLQNKLENASKLNPVQKKHTQMLEELERKVAQKQAEWDSEISKLTTERDQARETAQYAIENLSSAMEEYQRELANQKNLQTKLAALIREKEEQLNAAENKITKLENEKELVETSSKLDKMRYTIPERLSASETTNNTTLGVSNRRHSALEYYNSLVSNQELNINQQQQLLYSFNY